MDSGLDDDQTATWLAYRRMHVRLMTELDRQLARDSGMPQGYYAVLAVLAAAPDRRALLVDLARSCNFSLSRLSHAVARMEESGWVERVSSETSRRSTYAQLTSLGADVQAAAAVGHDEAVRRLVFDALTTEEARVLRGLCETVVRHLATTDKG